MRSKFDTLKYIGCLVLIVLAILIADPRSLWDTIAGVDLYLISFVIILYVLNLVAKSYRWKVLMSDNGSCIKPPFRTVFANFSFSQAVNNVTPGRVLGEATRIYGASSRLGVKAGVGTALVVTEKIMDLVMATSITIFGMAILAPVLLGNIRNELGGIIIIAVILNLILIAILAKPKYLVIIGNHIHKLFTRIFPRKKDVSVNSSPLKFLNTFADSMAASDKAKRRTLLGASVLTTLIWSNEILRIFLIIVALGAPSNIAAALVVTGVSALSAVFLVAGSNHILISSAVLSAIGISSGVATSVGIIAALTSIWLSVPIGLLAYFIDDRINKVSFNKEASKRAYSTTGKGDD
ncbi:MAG: flippase-like domain-containing protein [Euryarchaeota archaeon]|nr:flippase-like domain-containing protein [Euryarchaeota archaeon]